MGDQVLLYRQKHKPKADVAIVTKISMVPELQ